MRESIYTKVACKSGVVCESEDSSGGGGGGGGRFDEGAR